MSATGAETQNTVDLVNVFIDGIKVETDELRVDWRVEGDWVPLFLPGCFDATIEIELDSETISGTATTDEHICFASTVTGTTTFTFDESTAEREVGVVVKSQRKNIDGVTVATDAALSDILTIPAVACTNDADCSGDKVCENGECTCPGDQVLRDGQCVSPDQEPTCQSDADCPGDKICSEGQCVSPPPFGLPPTIGGLPTRQALIAGGAVAGGIGLVAFATSGENQGRGR